MFEIQRTQDFLIPHVFPQMSLYIAQNTLLFCGLLLIVIAYFTSKWYKKNNNEIMSKEEERF